MLQRAANLLTTKGEPVPAIADAVLRVDTTTRSVPPMSKPHHRRAHSNTVPAGTHAPFISSPLSSTPHTALNIGRALSDGGASLGLSKSLRRTLKGGVSYIVRSRSKSKDKSDPVASADSTSLRSPQATRRSISDSPPAFTASPAPARSTSIKRHLRSASDALWKKPSASLPDSSSPTLSSLPFVGSPDEMLSALDTAAAGDATALAEVPKRSLTPIHEPAASAPADVPSAETEQEPVSATVSTPISVPASAKPTAPDISSNVIDEPLSPQSPAAAVEDVPIPPILLNGVPMLKVSAKKQKRYFFRLDPDEGQIIWHSKKLRIIPIETIKEIRTGSDARYYREQFQIAPTHESRWLTLVYLLDGSYKTLHLIAPTRDVFQMWETTIRRLYSMRQQLMNGLGHTAMRQAIWERQFWKGADEERDQKLEFDDVERMCRRLNINPSRDDLMRRFRQADTHQRGWLDFEDFRKFVKALKVRPELDRLFRKLCVETHSVDGNLRYAGFVSFMRKDQQSMLSDADLQRLFVKYASLQQGADGEPTHSPPGSPARNPLELAIHSAAITAGLNPGRPADFPAAAAPLTEQSAAPLSVLSPPEHLDPAPQPVQLTHETGIWTLRNFTAFLLSPCNAAFRDEKHDMTRPLPEYMISSSHNTYLVGHQLVGESTIEGYIRALLHSCRSVELDIYDGEVEPVIYHGKTLTTKVSLRDICKAISRYAFVASPYPIIISAEVHCTLPQQTLIAQIMMEVFGDALVKASTDGGQKIEVLPSPEDLKGRVLLKTKNLYISQGDSSQDKEQLVDTESSSTETSASDSDLREEIKNEFKHEMKKARENEAEMIKGLKSELTKARRVLDRVNPRRPSNPTSARPIVASPSATPPSQDKAKPKMSLELVSLLVYTVGVKCRGINKKEQYAPEHMFSLSENTANKMLKQNVSMMDLIKHNRTHLVRIYPKGSRIGSTNYEPHRYWSAGAQLVAINWQTFDQGYMINHAMFQRNERAGYVLKPLALRSNDKRLLSKRTQHFLDITIISAQQLPRPKDADGHEIIDRSTPDPYVEVSIHIPDWTHTPFLPPTDEERSYSPPANTSPTALAATTARTIAVKSYVVKNNGFNPVWEQSLSLSFDCVGDMFDLVFVKFAIKQEDREDSEPLALYCTSLAGLNPGYRHLPLHDAQLSQYLFSTLFVQTRIRNV